MRKSITLFPVMLCLIFSALSLSAASPTHTAIFKYIQYEYAGEGEVFDISTLSTTAPGICTLDFTSLEVSNNLLKWPLNSELTITPSDGITITKFYWKGDLPRYIGELYPSVGKMDESSNAWIGIATDYIHFINWNSNEKSLFIDYFIIEYQKEGEEEEPVGSISFVYPEVRGTAKGGVLAQSALYTGNGNITYSIEPDDVEIDPTTGDIVSLTGATSSEYTVTATVAGSSLSASYHISVEKPEEVADGKLSADLSFSDRYINCFSDEEVSLYLNRNPDISPSDLVISLDETDEGFSVDPSDLDAIKVSIDRPGCYTFRVETNSDSYAKDMTLIRFNVFPRLEVAAGEKSEFDEIYQGKYPESPSLTLLECEEDDYAYIVLTPIPDIEQQLEAAAMNLNYVEIAYKHDSNGGSSDDSSYIKAVYNHEEGSYNLANLDNNLNFPGDGYVKYYMSYGNMPDYKVEFSCFFVRIPKVPEYTFTNNLFYIAIPDNTVLEYILFKTDNIENIEDVPADPEHSYFNMQSSSDSRSLAPRRVENNDSGSWQYSEDGESAIPLSADGLNGIKFRCIKNISFADPENSTLGSPFMVQAIVPGSDNQLTGVESIDSDKETSEYYNMQGIRVNYPQKGEMMIRVSNGKTSKVIF